MGISVEQLMDAPAAKDKLDSGVEEMVDLILKAIPLAMGVAVAALSAMGWLEPGSGLGMLGIGLAALALREFRK